MVFRNWLLAVVSAGIFASVPVAAQDVNAALWELCEGVEPYDPADVDARRANADDFCAVLLSEPHKARSQLNKMIVRNRAALNPNRWYIDARRVPSAHRHRYDGAYVQLRRSWMGANWRIDWQPCDAETWESRYDSAYDKDYHCFKFTNDEDATGTFSMMIGWSRDAGDPHLYSRTIDGASNESHTVVTFGDASHGLGRIGDSVDNTHGNGNGNGGGGSGSGCLYSCSVGCVSDCVERCENDPSCEAQCTYACGVVVTMAFWHYMPGGGRRRAYVGMAVHANGTEAQKAIREDCEQTMARHVTAEEARRWFQSCQSRPAYSYAAVPAPPITRRTHPHHPRHLWGKQDRGCLAYAESLDGTSLAIGNDFVDYDNQKEEVASNALELCGGDCRLVLPVRCVLDGPTGVFSAWRGME